MSSPHRAPGPATAPSWVPAAGTLLRPRPQFPNAGTPPAVCFPPSCSQPGFLRAWPPRGGRGFASPRVLSGTTEAVTCEWSCSHRKQCKGPCSPGQPLGGRVHWAPTWQGLDLASRLCRVAPLGDPLGQPSWRSRHKMTSARFVYKETKAVQGTEPSCQHDRPTENKLQPGVAWRAAGQTRALGAGGWQRRHHSALGQVWGQDGEGEGVPTPLQSRAATAWARGSRQSKQEAAHPAGPRAPGSWPGVYWTTHGTEPTGQARPSKAPTGRAGGRSRSQARHLSPPCTDS